jgi:hypothetical protein
MILLTTSDWPSDWGWNADDRLSLTPAVESSSDQKRLVQTGSLLLTILLGIPCRRTMESKKARATVVALYRWASGMKCAALEIGRRR